MLECLIVDEQAFIRQNKPEWERLDAILRKAFRGGFRRLQKQELTDLGRLYRRVTADLSIATARGASSDLLTYLNELAGRAHGLLYVNRRAPARNALRFLAYGFPAAFRASLKPIGLATLLFVLGALFAFGLVLRDRSALETVVPSWIARNIDDSLRDAPSKVTIPDVVKPPLSAAIMVNNITVSIAAFATGVAFGIPTALALIQNGLMLGGLAGFFAGINRSLDFWTLILPHGVIELPAIFIAGGAGLLLASAVVRPGNVTRWEALRRASRRAIRLMAGAAALLVVAGLVEAFVTPSKLPSTLKLLFSAFAAAALTLYLAGGRSSASED